MKTKELPDYLRNLADQLAEEIADRDDLLEDGSLRWDLPGTILVFDKECRDSSVNLNLPELVDEMLESWVQDGHAEEGSCVVELKEWAQLLMQLSQRIEAALKEHSHEDARI